MLRETNWIIVVLSVALAVASASIVQLRRDLFGAYSWMDGQVKFLLHDKSIAEITRSRPITLPSGEYDVDTKNGAVNIYPKGPFRAYYSRAMAENGYGTNFYKRADGTEVEATVVVRVGQSWGDRWLDKEDRGIVVEWSRPGCPRVRQDSAW